MTKVTAEQLKVLIKNESNKLNLILEVLNHLDDISEYIYDNLIMMPDECEVSFRKSSIKVFCNKIKILDINQEYIGELGFIFSINNDDIGCYFTFNIQEYVIEDFSKDEFIAEIFNKLICDYLWKLKHEEVVLNEQ